MRGVPNAARKVVAGAVPTVLAGWFIASVLCQHPDRNYDKARALDVVGLALPDWRFFAPNPAVEDRHFVYRLASEDRKRHTEWRAVSQIENRRLTQAFWFPGRRMEKALVDVAGLLVLDRKAKSRAGIEAKKSFETLVKRFVQARVEPDPEYPLYQFMLVRYAGYDHDESPKYEMISRYERLDPGVVGRPGPRTDGLARGDDQDLSA